MKEEKMKKIAVGFTLLIMFFFLATGCEQKPQATIANYDLGPKISPSMKFISYVRTFWKRGIIRDVYLRIQDRVKGYSYTIAGSIDDFIWHPMENHLYFITAGTVYAVSPDSFQRQNIYTFPDIPGQTIKIYGWQDGSTIIFKQDLPEQSPSGSYCVLFDVQNNFVKAQYFLREEGWEKMPSGNHHKVFYTKNGKIRMLKDGKAIARNYKSTILPFAEDYYSLEIKYGNMEYEFPLLATGTFELYQPIWGEKEDRLFFASKNYYWRIDVHSTKLIKLSSAKNIQKGIRKEWIAATAAMPSFYMYDSANLGNSEELPKKFLKVYFEKDFLIVNINEQRASYNLLCQDEVRLLQKKYSTVDISENGDAFTYSHGGRIGLMNIADRINQFITQGPTVFNEEI